jgi:hypothetical protein
VDFEGWGNAKVVANPKNFIEAIGDYISSNESSAHIVIDEWLTLHNHYKSYHAYPQVLKELTSKGRHYGITAWICTQYPKAVPIAVRSNCSKVFCFKLGLDKHKKAVEEIADIKISQYLKDLPKHHYLAINNGEVNQFKPI